ncbi:MAG TPA: UDP-2,3-diacylglucosamine diphosphatase [Burkholderiaceae bacterium]|nr:UDP-2,3-diacylglucosamine diphosphatase [Burkholderiaceae bacterium]
MTPAPLVLPGPVLFISDLHLTPAMPRTLAAFERFLDGAAGEARALVILGDFFEFWVGDDERHDPFNQRVIALLRQAAERGLALYLMHGNRDFLLGRTFAREAGLALLPDPVRIEADGHHVLLSHGDIMCTDDVPYMRFRHWTRKPWVQRMFLALPLSLRLKIARRLRADSEAGRAGGMRMQGDVTATGVAAMLVPGAGQTLIHGHTHRPHRHDEAGGERWVLSDWDFDGPIVRADALRLDAGGLQRVPLAERLCDT